jgi:hypothetical protein
MTIQFLSLMTHPTVIPLTEGTSPFQGWGIRIGR